MCVSQYRAYCKAFKFKRASSITKDDKIIKEYGTFFSNGTAWHYTVDKAEMDRLAKMGNPYAKKDGAK